MLLRTSYAPPFGLAAALADGDGTVQRVSTVPAALDGQRLERFAVERHGSLTNNETTLEPLLDTIQQVRRRGRARELPWHARGNDAARAGVAVGKHVVSR